MKQTPPFLDVTKFFIMEISAFLTLSFEKYCNSSVSFLNITFRCVQKNSHILLFEYVSLSAGLVGGTTRKAFALTKVYFERKNEEKDTLCKKNSWIYRGEKRTKNVITNHVSHDEERSTKKRKKEKERKRNNVSRNHIVYLMIKEKESDDSSRHANGVFPFEHELSHTFCLEVKGLQ